MHVVDASAYFATTVSYKYKIFTKSTTGFKIINLLYLIADAVTRKARASFPSHFKDKSNMVSKKTVSLFWLTQKNYKGRTV
jgi:hypothetical protein